MKKEKGFTLIEILIVVGIIGILSSVILVGLNSSRSRARDSRRITDLRQVQQGLELYYTKEGEYPPAGSSWAAMSSNLTGAGIGVKQIPVDPLNEGDFKYTYDECKNGQDYGIRAKLETPSTNLTKDSIKVNADACGLSCTGDDEYCVAS